MDADFLHAVSPAWIFDLGTGLHHQGCAVWSALQCMFPRFKRSTELVNLLMIQSFYFATEAVGAEFCDFLTTQTLMEVASPEFPMNSAKIDSFPCIPKSLRSVSLVCCVLGNGTSSNCGQP